MPIYILLLAKDNDFVILKGMVYYPASSYLSNISANLEFLRQMLMFSCEANAKSLKLLACIFFSQNCAISTCNIVIHGMLWSGISVSYKEKANYVFVIKYK